MSTPRRPLIDQLAQSILNDCECWRHHNVANRMCDPDPTVERVLYERSQEWGRDNILVAINRLKTRKLIRLVPEYDGIRIVVIKRTEDAA
jgi:hypothetical protein